MAATPRISRFYKIQVIDMSTAHVIIQSPSIIVCLTLKFQTKVTRVKDKAQNDLSIAFLPIFITLAFVGSKSYNTRNIIHGSTLVLNTILV